MSSSGSAGTVGEPPREPPRESPREAKQSASAVPRLLILAAPALLALAVHAGVLRNAYVYDDVKVLASGGATASPGVYPGWFRVLASVSHRLDALFWRAWGPGPHLTNLLLVALACAVATALALALSRSRRIARFTGLLFAVHPVHVEVAASVENRKDALALIFDGLALLCWLRCRRPALRYPLTAGLLFLAVLSKEVAAVGAVFLLFVVDFLGLSADPSAATRGARPPVPRRAWAVLLLCVAGAAALLVHYRDRFSPGSIYETTGGQLHAYSRVLANSAAAVVEDARLLLWPARLSADYPLPAGTEGNRGAWIAGLAILALALAGAWLLRRRSPLGAFALLWPPVMLVASSNLIPLTEFFVADRYLYVPSFGICLLAAMALDALARGAGVAEASRGRWARVVATGILLALVGLGGARTVARCADWRDARSLWSSARRAGYETFRVNHNLGVEEVRRGHLREGIDLLRKATAVLPVRLEPRRALAAALLDEGRPDEAEGECRFVLQIFPFDPGCTYLQGEAERRRTLPGAAAGAPRESALVGLAEAILHCAGKNPAACAAELSAGTPKGP